MSLWSQIRRVLLVVEFNTLDQVRSFREAIKSSGLNVHECRILAIVDSKKEKETLSEFTSVVYISPQEYSFFGGLKNDEALKLFTTKFDASIQVGEIHKRVKKSLSRVKPAIRIGLNAKNTEGFEIALNSESESAEHLLDFVKQTLEKIK
ncbi:MAG: DUF6913 domain-containing protein [Cyclobacteriaceae bacterium]